MEFSSWLNLFDNAEPKKLWLPMIDQSQELIDYFRAPMITDEDKSTKKNNDWLHGQYQGDTSLQAPADFENSIHCEASNAQEFID
jgi:hypothetical protein